MSNSGQKTQGAPAGKVNRMRMALVESTSHVATVDSQNSALENKQAKWWPLALPALALAAIFAIHFLNAPVAAKAEDEKAWLDAPVLLAASTTSRRASDKSTAEAFVSSIAYSENNALTFINGKMVSEGDVVDDITVCKIHEDTVELEKNGKRWAQKVGE